MENVEIELKNALIIIQESVLDQQRKQEFVDSIICLQEELVKAEPQIFLIKVLLSFLSEVSEIKKELNFIKMSLDLTLDLGY
ncbi:hypothetical protein BPADB04_44320 [Bacillus paranthracis]|uniref:hypothetical protein n=1 Tax=Bacillaceae TaxID=186817 RepID=UPI00103E0F04|nr:MULTISPECIES: hypothetical protein [Bacillaceae]MED1588396.1 hypothetical protein [Bacillus pacificus]TBV84981.1 hypothetical protein EW028_23060 [Lysinibacillus sp. OL1]UVB75821.1 hypothetical protein LXE94_01225 [Bacillus subtilis]GIX59402.1 hypothetical protein BPADB04_44320 [Bacillus paranthracis]